MIQSLHLLFAETLLEYSFFLWCPTQCSDIVVTFYSKLKVCSYFILSEDCSLFSWVFSAYNFYAVAVPLFSFDFSFLLYSPSVNPPSGESVTRRFLSVLEFCPAGWKFRMWVGPHRPFDPVRAPRYCSTLFRRFPKLCGLSFLTLQTKLGVFLMTAMSRQ